MKDRPEGASLDLPPVDEVDRALELKAEDRPDLPGLYRMNAVRMPLARFIGLTLAVAVALPHNLLVLGELDLRAWGMLLLAVEAYCLVSWLILRAFFHRVRRVHLGTVFVWLDLLPMTALVYGTGGEQSLFWPVYFVRVADQMWIGRARALGLAVGGIAAYALLLLYLGLVEGRALDGSTEGMKIAVLGGMGLTLAAVAGQAWDVKGKAQAARRLILQLEDQSRELDAERRRAEAASQAKSEFLARMSHELRTPLNSVVGFTNVLLKNRQGSLESRDLDYLGRIRQNGLHLLALINDILDLARIEEGRMEIQPTDVDLVALVRDTALQMEGRVLGSAVRLSLHTPDAPLPHVQVDEARLRQVLINLVGNALKFTERGAVRIEVEAGPGPGTAALRIRDTGVGISAGRLPHIFEAFEQGEGGTSRRFGGSGLGLAISRSLCELMGLRLEVESEEGKGSVFSVLFPARVQEIPGDGAGPEGGPTRHPDRAPAERSGDGRGGAEAAPGRASAEDGPPGRSGGRTHEAAAG